MSDPFEALFPPTDPDDVRAWYGEHVAGTYTSNWAFLRDSAASSFFQGTQAIARVIGACQRGIEADQPRGETSAVLHLNWKLFASGSLLAATLTPAFALEAFLRHFAEVGIWRSTSRLESFERALAKFDASPYHDRLAAACALGGVDPLAGELSSTVSALVEFRNSTVHDSPLLRDPHGNLLRTKRGRVGRLPEEQLFGGLFPILIADPMPLDLEHARRAVDTHDRVVAHFERSAAPEQWHAFMESFGTVRVTSLNITALGGAIWDQAAEVQAGWRRVREWERSIPDEEHEAYLRGLLRPYVVREVQDHGVPEV